MVSHLVGLFLLETLVYFQWVLFSMISFYLQAHFPQAEMGHQSEIARKKWQSLIERNQYKTMKSRLIKGWDGMKICIMKVHSFMIFSFSASDSF